MWMGDRINGLALPIRTLCEQLDKAYPNRSRASDGSIGDAAHKAQGSDSDHNPTLVGGHWYVTAGDYTHDPKNGADMNRISKEIVRRAAKAASRNRGTRVKYVIFNRRIAGYWNGYRWDEYTGDNPHTHHMHVSVKRWSVAYGKPWGGVTPAWYTVRIPYRLKAAFGRWRKQQGA